MRAQLVAIGALLLGCTWPAHRFREDDAAVALDAAPDTVVADDTADLPAPTECPPQPERAAPCDELRHFPGTWVVDGAGVEFCREDEMGKQSTPPRRFALRDAARTEPSPLPAGYAETIEVRAGLSPYGVHVFVKVQGDPRVLVDRDELRNGDAVEVFLRGNHDRTLTGDLEVDEAHHLVLTPPSPTAEGLAARYSGGKRGAPLADEDWHSRRVRGGWEVELHYPWKTLGNQASPGMTMGFNVAIDLRDGDAERVRAVMHVTPVAMSASCDALAITPADPLCDDRTWCLAKAYVP